MKKRSGKIDKFVSLAGAEERRSGQLTGRSQRKLTEQLQRLGELNAYRQGYASKASDSAKVHSAHWKDYQNFLFRLDQAVHSQQQIVHDCEQTLESHRRQWMAKRQRVESLERVRDRYRSEENSHSERLEQRALDDLPALPGAYDKESPK